jgi:hypothetical protein
MKIRLETTLTDPRIFDVTIDFTGYPKDNPYFDKTLFGYYYHEATDQALDRLLKPLNIRRISGWKTFHHCARHGNYRVNIYRTTVISDREL